MAEYSNPFIGRDNPYLTDMIDKSQGDLVRNYNLTTQPAYNSAMVRSGSFGNAGVQQMNENAQRNMQQSLGEVSTGLRGQNYRDQAGMYQWDQGFNRQLFNDAYSQNMGNLQAGVGLLGTMAGYNANDLTNGTNIQNTPFNYWSQFSNAANGMGQGYGTQTSTLGSSTNPLMAGLGGAQLGSALWGRYQNSNNFGTSGNNYNGSSNDPSAANYTNAMDQGYTW